MWLYILIIILVILVYFKYVKRSSNYWEELGIPYDPPTMLFGSYKDSMLMKKHLVHTLNDIYKKHEKASYVGIFKFQQPQLLIRDPDLIKDILIKDFASFQVNDFEVNEDDVTFIKNPFALKGEEWKINRTRFIQCFTSAKMKALTSSMEKVSERFVKYIEELNKNNDNGDGIDAKNICTRFTVENVINTGFGLEAHCFQPGTSDFMNLSYKIFYPSFITNVKFLIVLLLPRLAKLLKIRLMQDDVQNSFIKIIKNLVEYRETNKTERKDFFHTLVDMKEKIDNENEYGMTDIISHSMSLFADGTETTSVILSYVLYELAANLDIQKKLREEIFNVKKKYNNKVTYEGLQEMSYLEAVIQESMRLHPAALSLMKICTKDYTLPPPYKNDQGKTVTIKSGTPISIPFYSLHYDEKYFPEPTRFNPDRFSDENKQTIVKCTYMPFGDGQRVCPGQRFAIFQIKMAIIALLTNFELRINKKTILPLQYDPKYIFLLVKGGIWLDFHKLQK